MNNNKETEQLPNGTELENEVKRIMSKIYTYEETRKREDGIEKMILQHLVRQWIPEYSYPGCDRKNVVKDFRTAISFTLSMYPSIRNAVDENTRYFSIISKSINKSISNAQRNFRKRKKLFMDVCNIFNVSSESKMKKIILDRKIDFLNFDINVFRNIIKIYDFISKYE